MPAKTGILFWGQRDRKYTKHPNYFWDRGIENIQKICYIIFGRRDRKYTKNDTRYHFWENGIESIPKKKKKIETTGIENIQKIKMHILKTLGESGPNHVSQILDKKLVKPRGKSKKLSLAGNCILRTT